MTDSEIPENFEKIKELVLKELEDEKILIEKHGSLSWKIFEIAEKWRADEISDSHFRELIRSVVDSHINDRHSKISNS